MFVNIEEIKGEKGEKMDANRRLKLVSFLSVVVLLAFAVSLFTAVPTVAKDSPNKHSKSRNWTYQTIPVSMQMEAGSR